MGHQGDAYRDRRHWAAVELVAAAARQRKAEREKCASILEVEGERQAENLRAKAAIATARRRKPRTIPSQITHYRERD